MAELDEQKKLAAAIRRFEKLQLNQAFDPYRPDSRPNPKQQEIMDDLGKITYRWVVAGNQSGKSQLAAREIAHLVNGTHPKWKKPKEWGDEPLTIIIAGQNRQNMESELWEKKLKPFLDMGEWKLGKQASVLQWVQNKRTGDKIIFLSHADGSDHTRRMLQGYVAHYVWLDEMPGSKDVLEELQRRVDARKGYFLATFTPKFRNDEIRRIVDASRAPVGKKYRMSKLDNPIYADRIAQELQKLDGYSESYKNTVLYGDWSTGDMAVYSFDYETMTVPRLPDNYTPAWRHVAALDPASKNRFGYTLWAEDPGTAIWYLCRDEYIHGLADGNAQLAEVAKRNSGYNVVKQICDPHENWFIKLANSAGITYDVPYDKNNRKMDLIKGLQHALSSGKIKIPVWNTAFIDEIQSCQWSETSDRIVNATSYHNLDCAQYFVDCMPKHDPAKILMPWEVELRLANEARIKSQKTKEKMKITRSRGRAPMSIFKSRRTARG